MTIWYTARGAGLAALVLLSLSTALGALVSRHGSATRRYVVQYLHRVLAGLGLGALLVHLGTVLADSYAHVSLAGVVIPFTAGYRPTALALGTLAAYAFVGVSALGLARGRMAASVRGARVWRALHGSAYVGWALAMLHGVNAGTDTATPWVRELYVACFVAVLGSVLYRFRQLRDLSSLHRHDRFGQSRRPVPQAARIAAAKAPARPALSRSGANR